MNYTSLIIFVILGRNASPTTLEFPPANNKTDGGSSSEILLNLQQLKPDTTPHNIDYQLRTFDVQF